MCNTIMRYRTILLLVLVIVLLSASCQVAPDPSPTITPQISPSPSKISILTPGFTVTPSPSEIAPTVNTTKESMDIANAKEAVETYYHLMEEKQYIEAYAMFSHQKPHLKSLDDWLAECEMFFESIELLSVQHFPDFTRTLIATTDNQQISTTFYESPTCKIFVVQKDVDYVGGWGAVPSGIDNEVVIVIKEDEAWHLFEINQLLDFGACSRYD
jgi:hypothetical protein